MLISGEIENRTDIHTCIKRRTILLGGEAIRHNDPWKDLSVAASTRPARPSGVVTQERKEWGFLLAGPLRGVIGANTIKKGKEGRRS